MKRRDLEKFLKKNGYKLLRHKRHFIWSNGERTVCVPNGVEIDRGLARDIMLQTQRKESSKTHRMA